LSAFTMIQTYVLYF